MNDNTIWTTVVVTPRPMLADAARALLERSGIPAKVVVIDAEDHLPDLSRRRDMTVRVGPAHVAQAKRILGGGAHPIPIVAS